MAQLFLQFALLLLMLAPIVGFQIFKQENAAPPRADTSLNSDVLANNWNTNDNNFFSFLSREWTRPATSFDSAPTFTITPSKKQNAQRKSWWESVINALDYQSSVYDAVHEEDIPVALASEGDWSAYLDQEGTGLVYYFNGLTGESRWDPPTSTFPAVKEAAASPTPLVTEGVWSAYLDQEGTGLVYYYNRVTGVSTWERPYDSFPDVGPTPLATIGDWSAYWDDQRAAVYYFNEETGKSQWTAPPNHDFSNVLTPKQGFLEGLLGQVLKLTQEKPQDDTARPPEEKSLFDSMLDFVAENQPSTQGLFAMISSTMPPQEDDKALTIKSFQEQAQGFFKSWTRELRESSWKQPAFFKPVQKRQPQAVQEESSIPFFAAQETVPLMFKWKQNPDGTITGRVASDNRWDGYKITTSPILGKQARRKTTVTTTTGSKYYLT